MLFSGVVPMPMVCGGMLAYGVSKRIVSTYGMVIWLNVRKFKQYEMEDGNATRNETEQDGMRRNKTEPYGTMRKNAERDESKTKARRKQEGSEKEARRKRDGSVTLALKFWDA